MNSTDSIQYYDHHANRLHEQWVGEKSVHEIEPFLNELKPKSRILDLGCGSGIDLEIISQAGHEAVGIDASSKMVELAKRRNPEAQISNKNYLFLTLLDHEFDGVWVNQSFQHLTPEMLQRVAAVCFKGLKRDGLLGIVLLEGTGAFEDREGDLIGPSRWIHLYTEKQICSMLDQTGYQILKIGRQEKRPEEASSKMLILAKRV